MSCQCQWPYSDVSMNLLLCLCFTVSRETCVFSLRKICLVMVVEVGGGIAIIKSTPGADMETWNGDGNEMTCTWLEYDLSIFWTLPGHILDTLWQLYWFFYFITYRSPLHRPSLGTSERLIITQYYNNTSQHKIPTQHPIKMLLLNITHSITW